MLTNISLEHFKCFEALQLPLAPLTLLSGVNASGKSTIMHALALLHQTMTEGDWNTSLILNDRTVMLGCAGDVIDKITGGSRFCIGLESDTFHCSWHMEATNRSDLAVPIRTIMWQEAPDWHEQQTNIAQHQEQIHRLLPETIWHHSQHAKQFTETLLRLVYISSDRIGPRETYDKTTPDQQTNVGTRGEFAVWFLHHFGQQKALEGLFREGVSPTLQDQTAAWMSHFFPGFHFVIRPVEQVNSLTLGFYTNTENDYHRPQHVGYGLTHTLPLLVCCLGAHPGQVILIETPESHLHPAGQTELGKFLARAAAAGVQIIIETHSDHILNGIRVAVKERLISPQNVVIHFFGRDRYTGKHGVTSPHITHNGRLSEWPEYFFDEYEKSLEALLMPESDGDDEF